MEIRRRAVRRYRRIQLQHNRADYWGMKRFENVFGPATPKELGIVVNTPCRCSCWQCGHKRENEGPTISEQRRIAEAIHIEAVEAREFD